MIGRQITVSEAQQVIEQMQAAAVPAPQMELTPENWDAEFGEDGIVSTPMSDAKMRENQYLKLLKNDRGAQFGMIKPTLTDPDVIVEDKSDATDGTTERQSSMVFVKTFVKPDGQTIRYFTSVTVNRDGMEVVVSSHLKERKEKVICLKMGSCNTELTVARRANKSSHMFLRQLPQQMLALLTKIQQLFKNSNSPKTA